MEEKKNLFTDINDEDIVALEAKFYVIQIGEEVFTYQGRSAFVKEKAEELYEKILDGLMDMSKNGSKEEIAEAKASLMNLKMFPLRVQ